MTKLLLGVTLLFFSYGICLADNSVVRLASTTALKASGFADYLLPMFEKETGYRVQMIAIGSGKALRLGREGKADLIWTHSPEAEERFVAEGHGVNKTPVMHSYFYIAGPDGDPAGIHGLSDPARALKKIAESESVFVSRGDDSGTHRKELAFWQEAGITPFGLWYVELGLGMKESLDYAVESSAYIMVDHGTFAKAKGELVVHVSNSPKLRSDYTVMATNPVSHEEVNIDGALAFIDWIGSASGKRKITGFKVNGVQVYFTD